MYKKMFFLIFAATLAMSDGFGIREILDYLLGGNYGNYPYPTGPGYYPGQHGQGQYGQGQYGQGQYRPGQYAPGHYPPGPPGAHPGCPLCDSSVYSYCYHKQAQDSCCCSSVFNPYNCGKTDCKYLHANSCDEHHLITNCCCVDLYKDNAPAVPVVV